jgi:hypothetical protein
MLPASSTGSTSIGPDYPERGWSGHSLEHSARRIAAPCVVLCALVLLVVAVADVQVARDRNAVDRDLATARVAAARVAEHLIAGDVEALGRDLSLLARSGQAARSGSVGFGWTIADRADLIGGHVRILRRDTARIATLAAAAGPLRDSLSPLLPPGAAGTDSPAMTGPEGPTGLFALDDLARGLNRYATAAERSVDPSAPVMGRAALATGLLPALAGAEGPRTWTVCRAAAGPCHSITVTDARSSDPVASRPAAGDDVLVIGVEPGALFQTGSFDAAAIFNLLFHLGSESPAELLGSPTARSGPSVTIGSVVATEQQAITALTVGP